MARNSVKCNRIIGLIVLTGTLSILLMSGVTMAQMPDAAQCANLVSLKIEDTNLLSASVVPAQGALPAFCRVLGFSTVTHPFTSLYRPL